MLSAGDDAHGHTLGYVIARGDIDVLKMETAGPFTELTVQSRARGADDTNVF
jgi:hypothetical protein